MHALLARRHTDHPAVILQVFCGEPEQVSPRFAQLLPVDRPLIEAGHAFHFALVHELPIGIPHLQLYALCSCQLKAQHQLIVERVGESLHIM